VLYNIYTFALNTFFNFSDMEPSKTSSSNFDISGITDNIIRLGLLFLLIGLCITFIMPFSLVLIWGAIISISVYPAFKGLVKLFHGQKVVASVVVTVVMLSFLVIPTWILTESMLTGIQHFRDSYQEGLPLIPPPGESVKNWPAIAQPIVNLWQNASDNLQESLIQHKDQLTELGSWLLSALGGFGKGVIQFLISILLTAVFLVFSESLSRSSLKVLKKLSVIKGENFAELTVSTVRSVVIGILGVATIQAAMAGIGFFIAGVPFAGLWTILCLMLSVIQIGSWPVLIPMTVYMYSTTTPLIATLFAIWMIVVLFTDNILTPVLMGRRSAVPMLVLLIGSMGGFISIGFLGLFIGAVILSIGYNLFVEWLNTDAQDLT
jgi:predicted PurR-regulated permease PerM